MSQRYKRIAYIAERLQVIADEGIAPTQNVNPNKRPNDRMKDGTPNPDTEKGRAMLINQTELAVADIHTRAKILQKAINNANNAEDAREFLTQIVHLNDAATSLLENDAPKLIKEIRNLVSNINKARGRDPLRQKAGRKLSSRKQR